MLCVRVRVCEGEQTQQHSTEAQRWVRGMVEHEVDVERGANSRQVQAKLALGVELVRFVGCGFVCCLLLRD